MSDIPVENYERIFRHKEKKNIKIEYQRNPPEQKVFADTNITLIDDNGKKINKITVYHKNKIYKQAKELRKKLREDMCTKSECWNPNNKNINKMIRELQNPKVKAYQMAMQAIGAEPKDYKSELIRKGR